MRKKAIWNGTILAETDDLVNMVLDTERTESNTEIRKVFR